MNLRSELIALSNPFKSGIEWVQSAGGNTSVKDQLLMEIKASGMRLSDINEDRGAVDVNHKKVSTYFYDESLELNNPNKESKEFVTSCIVGSDQFLPSMETGFHAVLNKYVVHTHPMYLNVILCSKGGEEIINDLFKEQTYIPYITPGYPLSKAIARSDKKKLIFLENHGLISHSDNLQEAIDLHLGVTEKLDYKFPAINYLPLERIAEEKYCFTDTDGLLEVLNDVDLKDQLFPDQAVFLHNKIGSGEFPIQIEKDKIMYSLPDQKVMGVHEVLYSVLWILNAQKMNNLAPKYISDAAVAEILGLDMEKYRQSL
jgi:ribulose-5-phosphate 4-epimerase/fuculose-1-phosphate aldolase